MGTNKRDLKAYVRYDGTGRIVPGSLILQRLKPKDGNWKQIGAYECCDPYCLPPVYGEDFIIDDVVEGENGVTFEIGTNPITNVVLQVCIVSCESDVNRIIPIQTETIPPGSFPDLFNYFVPYSVIEQGCAIAFRRVCVDNVSGWNYGFGG